MDDHGEWYHIGEWANNTFGSTGEELYFDDSIDSVIKNEYFNYNNEYQVCLQTRSRLEEEYYNIIKNIQTDNQNSGDTKTAKRMIKLKNKYDSNERELHYSGVRLATVIVIQTIRDINLDESEPTEIKENIADNYASSNLLEEYFELYMSIIKSKLNFDDILEDLPNTLVSSHEMYIEHQSETEEFPLDGAFIDEYYLPELDIDEI